MLAAGEFSRYASEHKEFSMSNHDRGSESLGKALAEDGSSYLGLPVSTLKWAIARLMPKKLKPEYYFSPNEALLRELYDPFSLNYLYIKLGTNLYHLPVVIEIDNSLSGLSLENIKVSFSEETFSLDKELEAAATHFFSSYRWMLRIYRKKYFDGELARLKSILLTSAEVKLFLQPVRYSAVCKTHMCLDAPIGNKDDTIRYRVHRDNSLQSLEKSRLANALGVNTLLFTADGELIIQKRARNVVVASSLLGPPSSGDFEADDFRPIVDNFQTIPFFRESKEELHIHHRDIKKECVKFLGITRELLRGGKPEMFFMALTDLSREKVIKLREDARDKWESSSLIFWPFGGDVFSDKLTDDRKYIFRKTMDDLLNKHRNSMSLPLLSALALWQKKMQIQA